MSSGRNYNSYPGNRRPTPTAPPLSPRTPRSPLDIDPPIEDVYEQEERDAELARRLQVRSVGYRIGFVKNVIEIKWLKAVA